MELYESCYGLMSPMQFKDYVLAQRIKRLKLKTLVEQSLSRATKLFDEQNNDGNAMNLSKLSKELKDCNPGDVKRAENIKELIEQRLKDLIATKEEIESSRSKLFDEKANVRIWKANELAFHEKFIKELEGTIQTMNATHTKVSENCLHLKRKFPHCLVAATEEKRQKKRKVENAYKVKMRRERRLNVKCEEICKVLCPKESVSEIKSRNKRITAQDIFIADVEHLKIRSHYNALVFMVEKGFFDSSGEEEAKKILERMDEERDRKKKIKTRQEINREAVRNKKKSQKTIFAAFASSRCASSSEMTSSSSSDSNSDTE